ncbi:MAG TPA: hypothetical protein VFW03_02455 [Gemmatimonadaceae bacterium]|nr:hypothetical protein [Gemmatimonadaceae bacterium]
MTRVASRSGDRVRRQAMPVVNSILWKPLRDSHYVLTSVQPDQGGFRQIFVQQALLDRIRQKRHGPPGQGHLGLLLGGRWDCPITGTRYVVIQSFEETHQATHDSKAMTHALAERLAHHSGSESIECVGWYSFSNGTEPAMASAQATVHASLFEEPWLTALIVAEGGDSGAFFLHDKRASRWFQAPFYEVTTAARKDQAPKTTCIAWPAYVTTETVVLRTVSQPEASPVQGAEVATTPKPPPSPRPALSNIRRIGSAIRSSITGRAATKARKAAELAETARVAEAERKEQARTAHAERLEQARAAAAEQAERSRLAAEQAERERLEAERGRIDRERAKRDRAERERAERDTAEKERSAAERARQARVATQPAPPPRGESVEAVPPTRRRHTPPRVIDDGEDTTASDHPYRYLALARREGFQVSANLEVALAGGAETVWLLNEQEFGLQITLVTNDVAVVEATLHYNIRIKDDAVLRATRPEHRHVDSRTIYVRESCVESLRARCRQLRSTGALQRDWKVSPHIYPPAPMAQ